MKTIADLIDPRFKTYGTLAAHARVLQSLMKSARLYRSKGRWGSSGPHEVLSGYSGCVNCEDQPWHSSRNDLETWASHRLGIRENLLAALIDRHPESERWRREKAIDLHSRISCPYQECSQQEEQQAFESFFSLHGSFRPGPGLNSFHRDARILCFPQIYISPTRICAGIEVTTRQELKKSGRCASRWCVFNLKDEPMPAWKHLSESFASFLHRARQAAIS